MKSSRTSALRPRAAKPEHPLEWLAEPLADEPTLVLKAWFGGRTIMLDGKHQLFLTTQGEPWQGVLVCTFHEHQESLPRGKGSSTRFTKPSARDGGAYRVATS